MQRFSILLTSATSLQTEITMWCGRLDSKCPEWQECSSIYYSLDYKQKWCQIRADLTIKRFFLSIISINRFSLSISGLIPAFVACIRVLTYLLLQTMFNSCINMIRISNNSSAWPGCFQNSMIHPFLNPLSWLYWYLIRLQNTYKRHYIGLKETIPEITQEITCIRQFMCQQ